MALAASSEREVRLKARLSPQRSLDPVHVVDWRAAIAGLAAPSPVCTTKPQSFGDGASSMMIVNQNQSDGLIISLDRRHDRVVHLQHPCRRAAHRRVKAFTRPQTWLMLLGSSHDDLAVRLHQNVRDPAWTAVAPPLRVDRAGRGLRVDQKTSAPPECVVLQNGESVR